MSDAHVFPPNDLIEHERSDDCACGPHLIYVGEGGLRGWFMAHPSLDGREFAER